MMKRSIFGKAPAGKRLERILQSPNYRQGAFQNIHHTPTLKEGYRYTQVLYEYFFKKAKQVRPDHPIPAIQTDLKALPTHRDLLVWFGHSSYYFQLQGKRFLVDPVFSDNASPVPGSNRPFRSSERYRAEDMPQIDYLIITHDHYDHLDYQTVVALKTKIGLVITGLGVGAHLEGWGYNPAQIKELDWGERVDLTPTLSLTATPARHFSGRTFKRNNTLWLSLVLQSPDFRLFIGGDSGYDTHFKEIGDTYGPFDLAILENGQYNLAWHYIHMLPQEVRLAAEDLKAKRLLPVHAAKFALANHPWDEPLKELSKFSQGAPFSLITPLIGAVVDLRNNEQVYDSWWLNP